MHKKYTTVTQQSSQYCYHLFSHSGINIAHVPLPSRSVFPSYRGAVRETRRGSDEADLGSALHRKRILIIMTPRLAQVRQPTTLRGISARRLIQMPIWRGFVWREGGLHGEGKALLPAWCVSNWSAGSGWNCLASVSV